MKRAKVKGQREREFSKAIGVGMSNAIPSQAHDSGWERLRWEWQLMHVLHGGGAPLQCLLALGAWVLGGAVIPGVRATARWTCVDMRG